MNNDKYFQDFPMLVNQFVLLESFFLTLVNQRLQKRYSRFL